MTNPTDINEFRRKTREVQEKAWFCGCGGFTWILHANGECVCAECHGISTVIKVGRASEGTLTITRDVTTVSPNFKVTAMTVSDVTRGPCPLCGRTDNHTHAAGPFGMS